MEHRARSILGRREILSLAALVPAAAALSACGAPPQPKAPDPLEALRQRAANDSALAQAVAAAYSDVAEQARMVAADRAQHANALQREIYRVNPPSTPPSPTKAPPQRPPQPPPSSGAAKAALASSLRTAQQQAAALVPTLPTYRAGLVGSVAAGCASLQEVLA